MVEQPNTPGGEAPQPAHDSPSVFELDLVGDLWRLLRGRKTYLIAATLAALAIGAWSLGKLGAGPASIILFEAVLCAAMRWFIARLEKSLDADVKPRPSDSFPEDRPK